MSFGRRAAGAGASITLGVLLGLANGAAGAAEDPAALRDRAREQASAGHCDEALPLLDEARAGLPDDAGVANLIGLCRMQRQEWEAAAQAFADAKRLDPDTPDVDLHLAVARFHAGDVDGAELALDDARVRSPGSAEVDLYDGLIRLERAEEPVAAAEALERARGRDPVGVEPVASYYAGVAWLRAKERERAREALERVQREAPGTSWAAAAERALAGSEGRALLPDRRDLQGLQQAERPLGRAPVEGERQGPWVVLSGGFEYDSNVLLRGDNVSVPDEISDEGDVRGVWTAQVGTEVFRNRDWAVGILGAFYGSAHFEQTDFDTQYPSATAWVDRRLAEATLARLQYDFSYAWVGYDGYLLEHSLTPALFHDWGGRWGNSRLFAELSWDDYRFDSDDVPDGSPPPAGGPGSACPDPNEPCGPFGLDESEERNRDGFWSIVGFDHMVPVEELRTQFSAGYRWHHYDAEGEEYDFQGHEFVLGTRTLLPWQVVLDLQGSYTYRPYDHPSTYPNPNDLVNGVEYSLRNGDKRENVWQADVIVERPITNWLIGSLRYEYTRNDSNVEVFDYDRHVVGGYLTLYYQPDL
ncbi:MAG: tetratricopeptide repeat protein [Deltaproteobacteria bacterium]|nr:tetratricopeptide repeat protein [Deltaproteobacteria bacterium]